MQEKLEYESLDELLAVLQAMHKDLGSDLKLWKADVDSAFRRIPVLPAHRQFASVAFRHKDNVVTAQHLGMPFGSVASVPLGEDRRTNNSNCAKSFASASVKASILHDVYNVSA